MSYFDFVITEFLQREVEVEAENEDEAWEKVNDMYADGKIALDSNDFADYVIKEVNR